MYKIILDNEHIIQDSINNVVIDPVLKEKINSASTFEYSIPFDDKYYDSYEERVTTVTVMYESRIEFKGRLIDQTKNFDGTKKLSFESELAYLNDIQYLPYEYTGDYDELFKKIINYYNSKCSKDKQFNLGQITMMDSNNYILRSCESYSSCWNVISEKILSYGGYINIRYVGNERYIDLLAESGGFNSQTIEFGKNLLDLENYISSTNFATVIIPLGASQDDCKELTDGVYRTYSANKLDIKTVNSNKNYIASEFVEKYGWIEAVEEWNDVTVPSNLLTKAKKRLGELILKGQTLTIKAIDLHFANKETPYFKIGDIIPVISKPHSLDTTVTLTERTRNINDPTNDTLTLGNQEGTLSNSINNSNSNINDVEEKVTGNFIQEAIFRQTKLLADGIEGNVIYKYNSKGKLSEICFLDTDSIYSATNVLKINSNGLGFSTSGYSGPYRNAWTIDGTLNADFIKSGTLQSLTMKANKILGGSININNKFIVNSDGKLEAIEGNFTGNINGSTISGSKIKGSTIEITPSSTSSITLNSEGLRIISGEDDGFFKGFAGELYIGARPEAVLPSVFSPITFKNTKENKTYTVPLSDGISKLVFVSNIMDISKTYVEITTIFGTYGISVWQSDKSLKENILNSNSSALNVINSIKHREFDWKGSNKHTYCGYIAQELKKINEDFVLGIKQEDGNTKYQIDQATIIPYLSKSIQELSSKIDVLEAKIKKLEGDSE